MTISLFTIADTAPFDWVRGGASVIGVTLLTGSTIALWQSHRHPEVIPPYVRFSLLGWLFGDIYVGAREAFEIGRPLFLFGLPLALAWEACALAYLRRLWVNTDGLRRRARW